MHVTDLVDGDAVARYLFDHLTDGITDEARAEARALVDEALSFSRPPAGAHVVAARLAEWEGDMAAFADHTRRALAIDRRFPPALDDRRFLDVLHRGAGRKAHAVRHADSLLRSADLWTGRPPQLTDQLALAGRVIGLDPREHGQAALAAADQWPFLGFLLFEGGLLERFARHCGPLLPPAERDLLPRWQGARHRLVRLEGRDGRRWRFADAATGEPVEASALLDHSLWPVGQAGLTLLLPAGDGVVLVGEPVLLAGEALEWARSATAGDDVDPLEVATEVLRTIAVDLLERVADEVGERIRFVFPDLEPHEVDTSEMGLLELVRERRPELAADADGGDAWAEAQLLVEAIVAHRVITLRVPHTWELAEQLLAIGGSRESVLETLREATYAELWHKFRGEAA